MTRSVAVIPARYASTRFHGKPLVDLGGKTILQHVYDRTKQAGFDHVMVATDDVRIRDAAEEFRADVVMTSKDAPSGTDRMLEAIQGTDYEIVVNVQGDEPFVDVQGLRLCLASIQSDPAIDVATMSEPIHTWDDVKDSDVVKVVTDARGFALYFSRAPIPYPRDTDLSNASERPDSMQYQKHIGVYAYRRSVLEAFAAAPQSELEKIEKLEQLRILQMGKSIKVIQVQGPSLGIDTPEDLERAKAMIEERNKQ